MLFLTILSISVGILGLLVGIIVAVIQYRSRIKTERILKTQLSKLINRIGAMVPNSSHIEGLLKDVENRELIKWVHSTSKGLSDLYIDIVEHYLSSEKKFAHKDLDKMKKDGVLLSEWKERNWRDLIARLPENVNKTGS